MNSSPTQGANLITKLSYNKLREAAAPSEQDSSFLLECDNLCDAYASPKGYISWKDYSKICLAAGCLKSLEESFMNSDAQGAVASTAFRLAVINRACARYASKEIVESFSQTALPELPPEITQVLPFVHLMLPRNTVYDTEGDEVTSVLIQSGKLYVDDLSSQRSQIMKAFFPEEKIAPQELLGAHGLQIVTVTATGMDVFQQFVSPNAKSWHDSNVKQMKDSKYNDTQTEAIIRIAVNSLLVHLYEPELITTDPKPVTKGIGFSGKRKAPMSPTWIGKTFKKVIDVKSSKREDRTRSSVRSHWRRGHWHSVCIGPKKAERRVQWFKPVYVNPIVKAA